jgi:hypothetical protein
MGRQLDKGRKTSFPEVKENLIVKEKVKPSIGSENKDEKHGSLFSCANLVMMVFTVGIGFTVALFVVEGVELKQLNTEQQQTIDHLKTGAETLE